MTARVIPLRPSPPYRSRPAPSPLVPVPARVRVEWDGVRGLYVAICDRCCESLTTDRFDQADGWAENHTCDPELAALLDDITRRRRAA